MPDVYTILTDAVEPGSFAIGRFGPLDAFVVRAEGACADTGIHRLSEDTESLIKDVLKRGTGDIYFPKGTVRGFKTHVQTVHCPASTISLG
jgi:hypothetical protein